MSVPFVHTPALSIGAMAEYPYTEDLAKHMVVKSRIGEEIDLAQRVGDRLILPRECASWGPKTKDLRTVGRKADIRPNRKYPPRNTEQDRVIKESLYLLTAQMQSHIIEASTGFGKTFIGVQLAAMLGRQVLITVQKEDGLETWRDSFIKFSNVKASEIGIIQQKKCDFEGKKVCIGMVQTMAKDRVPEVARKAFGLVIFDEVHHMAADFFSLVCTMFYAKFRIGMSATTRRVDGREFVFKSHIGEVAVKAKFIPMRPRVFVTHSDFRLPRVKRNIDGEWKTVPLPHEKGKVMHINKMLCGHQRRNQIIVDFVAAAYERGRYTVVLSDLSVDLYLKRLRGLLVANGIPDEAIAYYIGGMDEDEREAAVAKKVVLATYQMAGENTDVPWWSALVLATPRANVKQAIGRILREYPDKPTPAVLDIVDDDSEVFRQYFFARQRVYQSKEINAEIVRA